VLHAWDVDVDSLETVEHATVVGQAEFGYAKTRFIGANADVGLNRGDRASMVDNGEQVGVALRTRAEAKPVIRAADPLARQAFTS
jgi:deoxyinosine 3'endonuclease (endonuclease V)